MTATILPNGNLRHSNALLVVIGLIILRMELAFIGFAITKVLTLLPITFNKSSASGMVN
ncbi:hypothetical protein [Brevibacillus nitrificans]|uniref:hypothetical protein n=1 Tax=Brevibacillus nitrificans TaxID=651560 RepID=UPI002861FB44|nr:hypothetical protein [Brevibacillus nitrificans]MDR7319637.1 hypothetical protein [Brevibacillus nitrificans]